MIAKLGDIYCIRSQKLNKWCAYQVVKETKKGDILNSFNEVKGRVGLLELDWFSDELPTNDDLDKLKPLYLTHHSWNDAMHIFYTENKKVPNGFVLVGNKAPIIDVEINTYGGWPTNFQQVEAQYIWMQLPEKIREQHKEALASPKKVIINGHELSTNQTTIREDILENFSKWEELDKLPALYEIHYRGNDKGIINYIKSNYMIEYLDWREHGHKIIDLSSSNLSKLIVDIKGLEKLSINDSLGFLSLNFNSQCKLNVIQNNKGKLLHLWLYNIKENQLPEFDLPDLNTLSLVNVINPDISEIIKKYPVIENLELWGSPGNVSNIAMLSKLKNLKFLYMKDIFGYTGNEFPTRNQLPQLEHLELVSLPSSAVKPIKIMFSDCNKLEIVQGRTDAWLEANAKNPFRCWDSMEGMSKKHAKDAFNAYNKALEGLSAAEKSKNTIKTILKTFVDTFNNINKKHDIDTIEREEIYGVYCSLLTKFNLDDDHYLDLFDEWRYF